MARKRIGKGGEASAATPNAEKLISAKKILRLEPIIETGGSAGTDPEDLSSVVSKRKKIALLAYTYWMQRGCQGGSAEEDWFRAEREIDSATSNSVAGN